MNFYTREIFLTYTAVFLLVLLVIAMALAAFAGIQPLAAIHWNIADFAIGTVAAFLMIGVFGSIRSVREEAEKILGACLAECRWYDLIPLAILVGIIEELLFRGVLEPWGARISPLGAFLGVNIFFGVLHAVSFSYFVVATLLGCLLSLLAYGWGEFNLLRPIVAHAVYDYIAFLMIASSFRKSHPAMIPEEMEDDRQVE